MYADTNVWFNLIGSKSDASPHPYTPAFGLILHLSICNCMCNSDYWLEYSEAVNDGLYPLTQA